MIKRCNWQIVCQLCPFASSWQYELNIFVNSVSHKGCSQTNQNKGAPRGKGVWLGLKIVALHRPLLCTKYHFIYRFKGEWASNQEGLKHLRHWPTMPLILILIKLSNDNTICIMYQLKFGYFELTGLTLSQFVNGYNVVMCLYNPAFWLGHNCVLRLFSHVYFLAKLKRGQSSTLPSIKTFTGPYLRRESQNRFSHWFSKHPDI